MSNIKRDRDFGRLLAIADAVSQRIYPEDEIKIRTKHQVELGRHPEKAINKIHQELMSRQQHFDQEAWELMGMFEEIMSEMDINDMTNTELGNKYIYFMHQQLHQISIKENIKSLFKMVEREELSNYKISQETGIAQTTLGRFTTGKSKIGNMSLDNAVKLNDYFLRLKGGIKIKTYEGSYVFNVNVSEDDERKIEQEVNRIYNMLNDFHNEKEIDGLETLLYELELEVSENEDNIASIESVEYGKLNTDTGYNHFVVADVEIETVEEYNVSLTNVRTFKELE